ncbi:unnamed protein product, partial [Effrenium voratum]
AIIVEGIRRVNSYLPSIHLSAGKENQQPEMQRSLSVPVDMWTSLGGRIDSELDSLFSSIRSQSDDDLAAEQEKERSYAEAGALARACPERYLALLVTLAVEVPVALIINGGSKDLKELVGLQRYTLLMAFLPLTSAISGNVGLQASSLTTRAISHGSCTKASFLGWMWAEIATALILSVATGVAVGILALVWTMQSFDTGVDVGFAATVALSQAFSVIVAGATGTAAPLVFSFLFHGDAGKWAGPMETAIQDVAGSFAVVYLAQLVMTACIKAGFSPSTV